MLSTLGDAGNIYFVYGLSENGTQNIERYFDSEAQAYKFRLLRSMDEIITAGDVVIDGAYIADAQPNVYQDQLTGTEYIVVLSLNETGAQRFEDARHMAEHFDVRDPDAGHCQ